MTATGLVAEIKTVLSRGDWEEVLAYVESLSTEERRARRKAVAEATDGDRGDLATLLQAGILGASDLYGWMFPLEHQDKYIRVFRARSGRWRNALRHRISAELLCVMTREGLFPRPTLQEDPEYYLSLFELGARKENANLRTWLLGYPDFVKHDLWTLFELQGDTKRSFANVDKYRVDKYRQGETTWYVGLLEMERAGELPRDRLLDASLNALRRDWPAYRSMWHARLHSGLNPTDRERTARKEGYLDLLRSSIPQIVSYGVDCLKALWNLGAVTPNEVIENVEPALQASTKRLVKAGVKLIEQAVLKENGLASTAAHAILAGLEQEAADLQDLCLDLLLKIDGLQFVRSDVEELLAHLSPSVRETAEEALGTQRSIITEKNPLAARWTLDQLPSNCADLVSASSRLLPKFAIAAIGNVEELAHELVILAEDTSDSLRFDRVLDGLSQFGALFRSQADELGLAPLRKRLQKLDRPITRWDTQLILIGYFLCDDEKVEQFQRVLTVEKDNEFLLQSRPLECRIAETIARARRGTRALPLLALPTHRSAWIDPLVIESRMRTWVGAGEPCGIYDLSQALLRLAPEHQEETLQRLQQWPSEHFELDSVRALRIALGDQSIATSLEGPLASTAIRARAPASSLPFEFRTLYSRTKSEFGTHHKLETITAGAGHDKQTAAAFSSKLPRLYSTLNDERTHTVRQEALVWPQDLDLFTASGMNRLGWNLEFHTADWDLEQFFEPFLDRAQCLTEFAVQFVVLGLGAKEPGQHGIAVDVDRATSIL